MIDAKNKFREGFVLIRRQFHFADMESPIQKLTIAYAYSEGPKTVKMLTREAMDKADEIRMQNFAGRFLPTASDDVEDYIDMQLEQLFLDPNSNYDHYEGEIVQIEIEGKTIRLYPDEYSVMSKDRMRQLLEEDGYHAICSDSLLKLKSFRDQTHYLKSRGVPEATANKWVSVSYGELVYYKPYFELLQMFCRDHEIYPDSFYERVEGVSFESKSQPKDFYR
jgi:hypothetical protein